MAAIRVMYNALPISDALLLAIKCNDKSFLNDPWVKTQITEDVLKQMLDVDIQEESKPMRLQWLKDNGLLTANHLTKVLEQATCQGSIAFAEWARGNGAEWDMLTCIIAAQYGHLKFLKWARSNGAPWDEHTCAYAALGGHLELLKWARTYGANWDEWTCANAAQEGHLEVLKWAREYGAPWDKWTCAVAAQGGHLEVLKWARANGAPWYHEVNRESASFFNQYKVLEWLDAN